MSYFVVLLETAEGDLFGVESRTWSDPNPITSLSFTDFIALHFRKIYLFYYINIQETFLGISLYSSTCNIFILYAIFHCTARDITFSWNIFYFHFYNIKLTSCKKLSFKFISYLTFYKNSLALKTVPVNEISLPDDAKRQCVLLRLNLEFHLWSSFNDPQSRAQRSNRL